MAGEDQEQFEDYLELERYIEELQADHIAHPPADLTPERARIYHMAALLRSASPEAAEPRPEFVVSLYNRLLAENNKMSGESTLQEIPIVQSEQPPISQVEQPPTAQKDQPPIIQPEQFPTTQKEQNEQAPEIDQARRIPRRARFFSRRSLLGGGAAAAASLVVGVGIGTGLERAENKPASSAAHPTPYPTSTVPIVPSEVAVPHFVANLAEVGDSAIRFAADTLIGYIILSDGDQGEAPKGTVIAMSASCTHMGCIVQWQDADRSFHCPCHGGLFTEYGKPDKASSIQYLTSLPRLETRIKDGKVYVMVPKSTSKSTSV